MEERYRDLAAKEYGATATRLDHNSELQEKLAQHNRDRAGLEEKLLESRAALELFPKVPTAVKAEIRAIEDKGDNKSDSSELLKAKLTSLEIDNERLDSELQSERTKKGDIPDASVKVIVDIVVASQMDIRTEALADLRMTLEIENRKFTSDYEDRLEKQAKVIDEWDTSYTEVNKMLQDWWNWYDNDNEVPKEDDEERPEGKTVEQHLKETIEQVDTEADGPQPAKPGTLTLNETVARLHEASVKRDDPNTRNAERRRSRPIYSNVMIKHEQDHWRNYGNATRGFHMHYYRKEIQRHGTRTPARWRWRR